MVKKRMTMILTRYLRKGIVKGRIETGLMCDSNLSRRNLNSDKKLLWDLELKGKKGLWRR